MMFLDEDFKLSFKKESMNRRESFISKISSVFELPDFHSARSILGEYYLMYPKLQFDQSIAKIMLKDAFSEGGFYFLDFSKEYRGGFPLTKIKNAYPSHLEQINRKKETTNWEYFLDQVKEKYWQETPRIDSYYKIEKIDLYKGREPETIREKTLSSLVIDGRHVKQNFFDITAVSKYYSKLFNEFFGDFTMISKVSNGKIKRYGKDLSNGLFLGLYVDFGLLKRELKKGYLEFPRISIELFSRDLDTFVKPDIYVLPQEEYDIGRVEFQYYIGRKLNNFRIGNSSQDEEKLKKDLFFYMDVKSFYLRLYLKEIEEIVNVLL